MPLTWCGSIDLGSSDEDADEKKQPPSYKAMLEFCTEDTEVKKQLAKEREDEIHKEFDVVPGDDSADSQDWQVKPGT